MNLPSLQLNGTEQIILLLCFGVMLGLTFSTLESYKELCVFTCNATYGEQGMASMGTLATSCSCRVSADYDATKDRGLNISVNASFLDFGKG
jgi:hypothetical protein